MLIEKGFNKFYWGFLFIMIDFRLQGIDVLPDLIGYVFLAEGFHILSDFSQHFSKAGALNIVMLALSIFSIYEKPAQDGGINYGIFGPLGILIGIVAVIIGIMSIYYMFCGIKSIAEKKEKQDIYHEANKRWVQYFLLQLAGLVSFILIFIPPIALIYVFAVLIVTIVFTLTLMDFMRRCAENLA
ncbi:hypothetical protein [Clostridium thermarum]|uniref:hypothetical protein n=1 Tax=Clostridium thermarum TaxID=1716543 RepID=UPI0013D7CEF6|nr:hypothetical protein [Clostridium thermarum]